jgi:hypothetical protein
MKFPFLREALADEVRVMCNDEQHRIGVTRKGRLVLLNHHRKRELARIMLGGEPPYCLEFLRTFKYLVKEPNRAPLSLRLLLREMHRKHEAREDLRVQRESIAKFDSLGTRERMACWIRFQVIKDLFDRCEYVLPPAGTYDFNLQMYAVGKPLDTPTLIHQRRPEKRRDDGGELMLYLPWRWWLKAHLNDMAVVMLPFGCKNWIHNKGPRGIAEPRLVQDVFSFERDPVTIFHNRTGMLVGTYRAKVRIIDQTPEGNFTTRRADVVNGIVQKLYNEELGSMQWPTNRDF